MTPPPPLLPNATFVARRGAVLARLGKEGVRALVVASHGLALGVDAHALAESAEPVLFAAHQTLMRKARQTTDITDIRAIGPARYGAAAAEWLQARGSWRIGIVGRAEMPASVRLALSAALPGID